MTRLKIVVSDSSVLMDLAKVGLIEAAPAVGDIDGAVGEVGDRARRRVGGRAALLGGLRLGLRVCLGAHVGSPGSGFGVFALRAHSVLVSRPAVPSSSQRTKTTV